MAALALKAIDYGADRIPDKFFESIPGGFFTPQEKKAAKDRKRERRHKSEQRQDDRDRDRRRSRRDRTPPTDYSDYSGHDDTYHERDYRDKQRRHRAKSAGGDYTQKRSQSRGRGRHDQRSSDLDEEYGYAGMNRNERTPEFPPPPPSSEYRPYNPAEYVAPPATAAATGAAAGNPYYGRSPSIARPEYNYASQPQGSYPQPMPSAAAARYTPANAYTHSPVNANANASIPPPSPYPPYNPAEYASQPPVSYSPNPAYRAPGNAYPSPPPFYRQQSHSQPSLAEYPPPENTLTYNDPPSRVDSTSSSRHRRHGDGKQHRARSADHHKRSRSRIADKFRDRFDSIDQRERGLAASVGGALAGGLAGRAVGHGTLSTLAGAAIGAFGVREMEKRQEKKKPGRDGDATPSLQERSRSRRDSSKREDYSTSPARSRDRRADRYDGGFDSYSDSDSDTRRGTRRRRNSRREPRRNFD